MSSLDIPQIICYIVVLKVLTSSKLKYILSHFFNIRTVNISQPSSLKNKQTNFNIIVIVTYLHILVEIKFFLNKLVLVQMFIKISG